MSIVRGRVGRRFGLQRLEFRIVRVVAVGAEKVGPLAAGEVSRPFSVDSRPPVPVDISVTFTAEPVAFSKLDKRPVKEPQFIAILRIVTIQTPPHGLRMVQPDIRMFVLEFSLFTIDFHAGMAVAAGVHPLCHGRRGDGKLFLSRHGRRHGNEAKEE